MKLYIRVQVGEAASSQSELFKGIAKGRVPRIWTLVGSIILHVSAVLVLMVVSRQMSAWMMEGEVDWSRYHVEPLRLHLAQPLFFRAGVSSDRSKLRLSTVRAKLAVHAPKVVARPPRPFVPPSLELPPPPEVARDAPVILQPEFHPQIMPPPKALPPLAFWARQGDNLPKPPPPKDVVTPGRTDESSAAPDLAAEPVLAVPNTEQSAASINVSLPKTQPPSHAALTVPNSATIPVRVRDQIGATAARFEQFSGQSANIVAIARPRPDLRDLQIPRGLQNIPASQGEDATETISAGVESSTKGTVGSQSGAVSDAATRSARQTAPPNRAGGQTQSSAYEGSASAVKAASSVSRGHGQGPANDLREPVANGLVHPQSPTGVTRITHSSKGNFDVVIMQSSASNDLTDAGGILSGNPVYTVYLQVGDRKEWLLEYCLPPNKNVRVSPYQVNIDDTPAITPPYPLSTAIPNDIQGQLITKHIVIHGFLTAGGILRSVEAPEANSPLTIRILGLLGEWRFRPALRNKEPIDLEILLVIPARS